MKKKKGLIIGISAIVLALSAVLAWKFIPATQQTTIEQSMPSSPAVELTEEELVYKKLIGNLTDVINDSEKAQVQTLIKKLIDIENNGDNKEQKSFVYKDIIKVLDKVTLRGHSKEDLETYKKYYNDLQVGTNSGLAKEQHQYEVISDGTISAKTSVSDAQFAQHKQLWDKTKQIIPFHLLTGIKYFIPFVPPQDTNYAAGFMQPIDFYSKPYEWSIGVATIAKDNALPYILIHEYGHYISLNDPDLTIVTDFNKLSFEGGELLQSFVAQCDGHIAEELNNINQNNHYLFCARHKDDFVSKYAATNLLDDFAESFAHFVMGTSYDSDVLKRKMKFFEDRPEIVKIKNQILNNLKENNMGEIVAATQ